MVISEVNCRCDEVIQTRVLLPLIIEIDRAGADRIPRAEIDLFGRDRAKEKIPCI